jgi:hypothetical protein
MERAKRILDLREKVGINGELGRELMREVLSTSQINSCMKVRYST